MTETLLARPHPDQRPLHVLTPAILEPWLERAPEALAELVRAQGFAAKRGEAMLLPRSGRPPLALMGAGDAANAFALGDAATLLPEGDYALHFAPAAIDRQQLALAWLMGAYAFTRYAPRPRGPARIHIHAADREAAMRTMQAIALARDLINTPAEDLNTEALEDAVQALGRRFGATVTSIAGEDLLTQNFPLIHAVGRASVHQPRLVELVWGEEDAPRIAIIGKGIVFDTGGLDIKAAQYMRLMKKDMGGAANAMALAHMIMAAGLKVRLHLVLPIADNAISGNAYRPGDVLRSRKGLSVEVDNTDAEGRLVLADALARAAEENPDLMIDFATLTGAARVALGPELAPFYTADEALAAELQQAGAQCADPLWRMPLWDGYEALLDSPVADICHTASSPMAGSVTAALFLRRFAGEAPWLHFDIYAWVQKPRPAHPQGGDVQGVRAVFAVLERRYGGA